MTEPISPEPSPDASSSPSWPVLAIAAGCLIGGTLLLVLIRRAGASRFAASGGVPAPVIAPPEWDALPNNVQATMTYFSDAWEQRFAGLTQDAQRMRTEIGVLRAALAGNGGVPSSAPPIAPAPTAGAGPLAAVSMIGGIPEPQPTDPAAAAPSNGGPVAMASIRAATSM